MSIDQTHSLPPGLAAESLTALNGKSPVEIQMDWWKEYGDVWTVSYPSGPVVYVASPDLVQQLVHSNNYRGDLLLATEPAQGRGITLEKGEDWRRSRLLMQPMFSRPVLRRLVDQMSEAAEARLATLDSYADSGEVVDLGGFLGTVTIRVLVRTMFSNELSEDDIEAAVGYLNEISRYKAELMAGAWAGTGARVEHEAEGKVAVAALDEILYSMIARRREASGGGLDLLDRLIAAKDEEGVGFTDQEIRNHLTALLFGGYETTQWAMAWAFSLMPEDPAVLARAVAEADALPGPHVTADDLPHLEYLLACLEEAMRHQSQLAAIVRELEQDEQFGDYLIPAGTQVVGSIYVIHHREDLYPEPKRYDPTRFLKINAASHHKYQMLAFGGGPRICLGINLALFEAQVVMATFLRRFSYTIDPQWVRTPVWRYSVLFEGGVPVRLTKRDQSAVGEPVGAEEAAR